MTAALPADTTYSEKYEQERGKPMPSFNHYFVQTQLQFALHEACGDRYLVGGELSLSTEPTTTPDLAVCNFRHPDWLHDEIRAEDPPVMVVEILSPSQSVNEIIPKIEAYFRFGIRSVWLVLPPLKQVAVFTPEMEPRVFVEGDVVDPTLDASVSLDKIFS